MERTFLGIEIGGTKLQLVLGDESARIHKRWRLNVDKQRGGAGIREQIEATICEILSSYSINGIGVGFGGPVDWKTGKICCSHQIEGWSEFELGKWLQSLAKVPVRIDNDANVAGLGEAVHGGGRGFNPAFYVTLGSGVGGGLALNGQIYHGAIPGEAEIGHVRLDRQGTIVESRCSGWAVDSKIRAYCQAEPESLLSRLTAGTHGGEAKFLAQALAHGDRGAVEIVRETADDLAFGLSHVVHLLHPQVIVIGGGLSLLGEPLRSAVRGKLPDYVMEAFHPVPEIRIATLGEDVVPIGALELARQTLSIT